MNKPHSGMVPAIGSLASLPKRPQTDGLPEFHLPPSPVIPEIVQPVFSPFVRTFEVDPENLRPGVIEDPEAVQSIWSLRSDITCSAYTVTMRFNRTPPGAKSSTPSDP